MNFFPIFIQKIVFLLFYFISFLAFTHLMWFGKHSKNGNWWQWKLLLKLKMMMIMVIITTLSINDDEHHHDHHHPTNKTNKPSVHHSSDGSSSTNTYTIFIPFDLISFHFGFVDFHHDDNHHHMIIILYKYGHLLRDLKWPINIYETMLLSSLLWWWASFFLVGKEKRRWNEMNMIMLYEDNCLGTCFVVVIVISLWWLWWLLIQFFKVNPKKKNQTQRHTSPVILYISWWRIDDDLCG